MPNFARSTTPLAVTLVDSSELAAAGLRVLLAPFAERVVLVENRDAVARPEEVDIVLYEPQHGSSVLDSQLRSISGDGGGTVVAYSWAPPADGTPPEGVVCLSKTLTAAQLVVALEEVRDGRHPGLAGPPAPVAPAPAAKAAPAPDPEVVQLTTREHEVLTYITQGLPNRDIAARLGLSLNSVKTYIRTAYRKIGAERRTQAVLWGLEHGLVADLGAAAGEA